jgi:serine/threonine protein kinase
MPEKIGRYDVISELGRGGMATVYKANDPRFEREVAVKVLPHEMLHDPQFRLRFEREAKTIAMLEHPAIVPVYDFGEEEGQPYFVMRYMPGGSLAERMMKGPSSLAETARIFARIAPALDQAHAKGIIHRDLKPGNILFDQYNEPYVSDFGIAKLSESQTNVTGSAIVGTPAYMSPEQAEGKPVDGRADIYALGTILFEMLTGRQPYEGDTPMSVVVKHITDPTPHILDYNPKLPTGVEAVVEKAMAKNRDERYASATEMAQALKDVIRADTGAGRETISESPKTIISKAAKPVKTPPSPTKVQSTPRAGKGLWIGLGVGGVVLCLAVVIVFFVFKDQIPFLASAKPTATTPASKTSLSPTDTAAFTPVLVNTSVPVGPTDTQAPTNTPAPTDTPAPSPTPTAKPNANLGGADKIAFLNANNIYLMNVDGSELIQLTSDGGTKSDLQWSPDGQELIYISGKRVMSVHIDTKEIALITEFPGAEYVDAFRVSPDGTQVAISLSHELYVVPFNRADLGKANSRNDLIFMKGCFTYTDDTLPQGAPTKIVRWSSDSKRIAVEVILITEDGLWGDKIRVFDITNCASPVVVNTFPKPDFQMTGFRNNPLIPSFDWDGNLLFLLHTSMRNELGYLYVYNNETKKNQALDPLGSTCCYGDISWSPDGKFVIFAYQNINETARTQLFFVNYSSIGSGEKYTPLPLPQDFWKNNKEKPQPVLRPVNR